MSIDTNQILSLSASQQLQIVELIWDNPGDSCTEIPLPEWVGVEADRRRQEMTADLTLGLNHEQVWNQIRQRNG